MAQTSLGDYTDTSDGSVSADESTDDAEEQEESAETEPTNTNRVKNEFPVLEYADGVKADECDASGSERVRDLDWMSRLSYTEFTALTDTIAEIDESVVADIDNADHDDLTEFRRLVQQKMPEQFKTTTGAKSGDHFSPCKYSVSVFGDRVWAKLSICDGWSSARLEIRVEHCGDCVHSADGSVSISGDGFDEDEVFDQLPWSRPYDSSVDDQCRGKTGANAI